MSEVAVAKESGFCFGVKRAVDKAVEIAEKEGKGCTFGPLIHNKTVTDKLEGMGIKCVENIDDAKGLGTLILRSHGVPLEIYEKLNSSNINYIDMTCPFVAKIHKIVYDYSGKGFGVLIAGNKNHPEVIGIAGHSKNPPFIFDSLSELENYAKSQNFFVENPQIMVAQTTYDLCKWTEYKKFVEKHCTNSKIFGTICSATSNHQREAGRLAEKSDIMIVIGDKKSSNSNKLFHLCEKFCPTYFVQNKTELLQLIPDMQRTIEDGNVKIGITAGASTPAEIIKEVHIIMSEIIKNDESDIDFMAEVDKTFKRVYIGNRVKATVVSVNNTEAVVDIGTKHSGYIPADELSAAPNVNPKDIVKNGDEIECIVTSINDAEGIVYLSKKRVDAAAGLEKLIKANEDNATLNGIVTNVVKGGVIVTCEGARVFIPASQTGVPRDRRNEENETPEMLMKKLEVLLKKTVELKIIEVNEARGRVVGSIKAASKEKNDALKEKFWADIEVGKKYTGEVKSMESYGVFVDLGGVDGMVHSSELTWNRIKHPKEVVSIGDKLDVYVKSFDPEKKRVSLGAKNPDDNPWNKFVNEFNIGETVNVQVVSITPFGAFAQIIPGVDGLIHISQIAEERITNVAQVLSVGQVVEAKITDIDTEKTRVSLSMKALLVKEDAEAAEAAPESEESNESEAE